MGRALFPLAVAGCLIALMPPASRVAFDPVMKDVVGRPSAEPIASLIATYAEQYALDPALLQAIIKVESNFNADAVSSKGAIGLMQLMPLTAAAFHVLDPFDPKDNIRAGAALLRGLLDRFGGDLSLALAAYHLGEARVRQAIGGQTVRAEDVMAAGKAFAGNGNATVAQQRQPLGGDQTGQPCVAAGTEGGVEIGRDKACIIGRNQVLQERQRRRSGRDRDVARHDAAGSTIIDLIDPGI